MRGFDSRNRRVPGLLLAWLFCLSASVAVAEVDQPPFEFPSGLDVSPSIEGRVRFWVDMFGRRSSREAVVYDEDRPWRVIAVVPLETGSKDELGRIRKQYAQSEFVDDLARREVDGEQALLAIPGSSVARVRALLGRGTTAEGDDRSRGPARIAVRQGWREVFRDSLVRSQGHLAEMRRILREASLPREIAYLPHIESAFEVDAASSAGALGLWQLMPETARESTMRVDEEVDERLDPVKSTAVAASYLRGAYESFGSWPLAITSYNYGVSATRQAVETVGSRELGKIIERYDGPAFGFAVKNFYSQFLAAVHVARNHRAYFPGLQIASQREYVVQKGDTLAQIARKHGTTVEALRTTNRLAGAAVKMGQRLVIEES